MIAPWIDQKFAGLISSQLPHFKIKRTSPYLANFRCPFCGDSEKNSYKARGYIYQKKGLFWYSCHNCGYGCSFSNFLKRLSSTLFDQYVTEKYLENKPKGNIKCVHEKPDFSKNNMALRKLKCINSLKEDHPARKYVDSRKIPVEQQSRLFYSTNFSKWVNSLLLGKLDEKNKEPRLVIPFLDEQNNMFGFQGRSFQKRAKLRYISIMLDENQPKVFGLDQANHDKTCYITEGPIDALFLNNSLAMAGADVRIPEHFKDVVYVFDNEPRNHEIVKRMENVITQGKSLIIWPKSIKEKDINDMVLNNIDVEKVLKDNEFAGLDAKLNLASWRKC